MAGVTAKARGDWGEELVAKYLTERGYAILERNYRSRYGEIDLIAADGTYLAFVEVKLRKTDRYGTAGDYVTKAKQKKIRTTALFFLQQHPVELQPRFDVAEVWDLPELDRPDINYLENAFY